MSAALELKAIKKAYGEKVAVDDISFEIAEQSIYGLLGPNGAGKTSLIRIITQITGPDQGEVIFFGQPHNPSQIFEIGYMPEERGLYKKMKVGEQLLYLARLKNLSKKAAKERLDHWLEKFEITDWWNKKIHELSKGMQQKIQFIATVIHNPKLLILDEPFSGLDPINTNLLKDTISELRASGTTIIFSTHRMEQVEEICNTITLINEGRNVLTGRVADLKQQFKKNLFSIEYKGDLPDLNNDLMSVEKRFDNKVIIRRNESVSIKEILNYLLSGNMEIQSFNEILPSLNEIFIDRVNETVR